MSNRLNKWWQQWLTTVDEVKTRFSSAMRSSADDSSAGEPLSLSGLEPRILFSATPIDPAMMPGGEDAGAMVATVEAEESSNSSDSETTITSIAQARSGEIVIIDSQVTDLQQLLDDLSTSGRDAEVFVLDSERDGLDQITEILDARSDVSSIHVVSHSEEGAVKLGNVWLGESNLAGYTGQIASWQSALTSDADILFYGCELAGEESGRALVESIGALTGADVAASDDDTGHSRYGGDWDLEFKSGTIETSLAFSDDLQANWTNKLATITVDTFVDVIDGGDGLTSLREAVIQANAGGGGDTILLSAGTYTLTIGADNEDASLEGDLDILNTVTIRGAGADQTFIDGGGIDRVFETVSSTGHLIMSDVTVQGGVAGGSGEGGGIFVADSQSELTLNRVVISGNSADDGGGIFNNGTMTLSDVTITANTATVEGGGIHNKESADLNRVTISANQADFGGGIHNDNTATDLTLTNVTVSGNSAVSTGGGLYNQANTTITSSTFTLNDAGSGGGIRHQAGTITIGNTIVSDNTATGADPDVEGAFDSQGFNLIENVGTATGFIAVDIVGVSALLNPLADNGGFVQTHALQSTSQAIGQGNNLGAVATDARGFARRDGLIDIGAFESGAVKIDKLYWSDQGTGKIQRSNLDGTDVQDLVTGLGMSNGIGLFVDTGSGKLYWTDQASGVIHRANLDGGGVEDVVTGLDNPREITIDSTNGKIYWTEDGPTFNKIRRANLDGTGVEDLVVAGLSSPGGIALDVAAGKMYWVDTATDKVQRANLDGSNVEDLVTGLLGPRRLKVDLSAGKMYWTDDGLVEDRISRANLDGSGVEHLVTGLAAPTGIELDLESGKIYWTDFFTQDIRMSNLDGSNVQTLISTGLSVPVGLALGGIEENWSPTNITLDDNHVSENDDGAVVGNLGVVDPNVFDSHTWAVSDARFEIVGGALKLKAGQTLDKETEPTINLTITVTDQHGTGFSYNEGFMITVDNVNEAPTAITLDSSNVSENADGAVIGNLATTDPDTGDSHNYTVNDSRFEVVGGQLKLKAGESLDFESEPTVNIAVTSTDGGSLQTNQAFVITVDDANDLAPVIDPSQSFSVAEDVANNTVVGTVTATDDDTVGGPLQLWTITGGNADGIFTIDSSTGVIRVLNNANLDFETTDSYTLSITVSDGINPSAVQTVDVDVTGVNEAPNDITLDNTNVFENTDGGVVGNLTVFDPDLGDTHAWTVSDSRFEVVGNQLKLKAGQTLDRETEPTVNLTITATDQGGAGIAYNEGFAIAVDNVNESATDITIDNANVLENADGAVIGNLSVVDPDVGDTHAWSVSDNRFEVVGGQLKLKVGQSLDRETEPTINLNVTATDQGGAGIAFNKAFLITVDNANEAATDITLSGTNVDEQLDGAVVGTVGVVDPDAGDTHTWSVSDNRFEIVGGQLKLKAGQLLDVNLEPTVNLTITATDFGGLVYNEGFVITVDNVNQAPTDISLDNASVSENTDGGVIGNLGVTDPDVGDTHTWSVNDARFEIVGTVLKLKAGQSLDRETEPTVNLTVTVTDQGGTGASFNENFSITVDNQNEAATDITLGNASVLENADGAVIGNLSVVDPDVGDTHAWNVSDNRFEVVGGQLKLKAGQSLDRETEPTVNLTVTATDQGGAGIAFNKAFLITVDNANEAATDITLSGTNVAEQTDGAIVGTVGVVDPDAGDTHTWSVSDNRFEIVGGQLKLKAGQALDINLEPTVNLTITATDLGGLAYNEGFVITVDNVNQAPTDISLDNASVSENTDGGVIGNLGVADPDAGDTHTWNVNDARFEIVGTVLKLKAGQSLDRETEPTVNLTVTVTDQGGTGASFNENFSITVDNQNEAATDITLGNASVLENADGAVIGNLFVVDPDVGDTHAWNVSDNRFEVVGGQLKLKTGQSLDRETEPTVNLTVTATDQGGAGIAFNKAFLITVDNANEAANDITLSGTNVAEQTDGAVVGTVGVVDPDAGDTHTWSVSDNRFEIVGGQLKLKAGQALDINLEPTVNLTITATDLGGLAYNEGFVITVDNVNQAPTDISLDNTSVSENTDGGVIGNLGVADPDAGDTHTWSVNDARFEIVGTVLKLKAGQSLDRETEPTVNLTVTATDQGGTGTSFHKNFAVTVDDVNEAPVADAETFNVISGDTLVTASPGVLQGDIDPEGNLLTAVLLVGPANGSITFNADGSFTYTPDAGFVGVDTFVYEASDGANSSAATVTINVAPGITPLPTPDDDGGEEEEKEEADPPPPDEDPKPDEGSDDSGGGEPLPDGSGNPTPPTSGSQPREALVAALPEPEQEDAPWLAETSNQFSAAVAQKNETTLQQSSRSADSHSDGLLSRIGNIYQVFSFDTQWQNLDSVREELLGEQRFETLVVGAAVGVSMAVSVGHAIWALKAGSMASTLVTSMPIWRTIDPLPVLEYLDGDSGNPTDSESLQSIIQQEQLSISSTNGS